GDGPSRHEIWMVTTLVAAHRQHVNKDVAYRTHGFPTARGNAGIFSWPRGCKGASDCSWKLAETPTCTTVLFLRLDQRQNRLLSSSRIPARPSFDVTPNGRS